jgi:hypothetical protein
VLWRERLRNFSVCAVFLRTVLHGVRAGGIGALQDCKTRQTRTLSLLHRVLESNPVLVTSALSGCQVKSCVTCFLLLFRGYQAFAWIAVHVELPIQSAADRCIISHLLCVHELSNYFIDCLNQLTVELKPINCAKEPCNYPPIASNKLLSLRGCCFLAPRLVLCVCFSVSLSPLNTITNGR